jgi:hypothetical protein
MGTLASFTVSVAGAAAVLAGCGSFQAPVAQNAATQATVHLTAINFAGEKFTSTSVSASCLLTPGGPLLKYTATGSASGPVTGTFSASGNVLDFALLKTFQFSETFEVQSGTQTFAGTVKKRHGTVGFSGCHKASKSDSFKATRVAYSVDHSRGKTSMGYSKLQFHESFY